MRRPTFCAPRRSHPPRSRTRPSRLTSAASSCSPTHVGALAGARTRAQGGRPVPRGRRAYNACIRQRPDLGETYWSLANLKTYRFDDETVREMEKRIAAGGSRRSPRSISCFALGKAYEDRGDFERAWEYYRRGNDKQRAEVVLRPGADRGHERPHRPGVFTREFLESRRERRCITDPAPIFILGLPRSGSTLLEQILASHSQVEGTSELPYLGRVATWLNRNRADGINYPEAVREFAPIRPSRRLGGDYLRYASMHRRSGTPRFIDKMPNNFPNVGFLSLILPNAKIIDARRHPLDACLSCYRQLFAKGQTFTYDLTEIGEYYLQYQRMMDHWHACCPAAC